jgi:hypothetical protein
MTVAYQKNHYNIKLLKGRAVTLSQANKMPKNGSFPNPAQTKCDFWQEHLLLYPSQLIYMPRTCRTLALTLYSLLGTVRDHALKSSQQESLIQS